MKAYASTEAIIGGVTGSLDRPEQVVLGRYDSDSGEFRMVARTVPIPDALADELAAVLTEASADHPWPDVLAGFWIGTKGPTPYVRVVPEVVAEIRVDPAIQAGRWRHGSRLLRLRPDLTVDDVPHDVELELP